MLFEEQKRIEKEHAEHRAKTEESYAKQLEEVRNLDANN
jgi:phage host-nuclease inhibitor protein Gam